jgi:hypothetical protein
MHDRKLLSFLRLEIQNFVNLVSLKRRWWKETQPGKLHALNQGSEISVHTAQYQHNKKASE